MKVLKLAAVMIFAMSIATSLLSANAASKHEPSHSSINNPRAHTMKFNNYVYIFLGPNLDPKQHRSTIKTDAFTFTAIGIDFQHKEQVIEVAKDAIANGAQIIELCGGFGPLWIAKITDAIHGQVPVGSVAYGPEARKPLLDLLS